MKTLTEYVVEFVDTRTAQAIDFRSEKVLQAIENESLTPVNYEPVAEQMRRLVR